MSSFAIFAGLAAWFAVLGLLAASALTCVVLSERHGAATSYGALTRQEDERVLALERNIARWAGRMRLFFVLFLSPFIALACNFLMLLGDVPPLPIGDPGLILAVLVTIGLLGWVLQRTHWKIKEAQ